MVRLEREYRELISALYVLDGEEFITAAEAENYLPADCNLTDCYDEFYTLNEDGEYEIDYRAYDDSADMELELFGDKVWED